MFKKMFIDITEAQGTEICDSTVLFEASINATICIKLLLSIVVHLNNDLQEHKKTPEGV